jgi:hypothetical protein
MYPLHSAQLRLAVIRLAANRAVDRAMRRMHDGPESLQGAWVPVPRLLPPGELVRPDDLLRRLQDDAPHRFHERMKVDESNCRWCGLAQREALEELEGET